MKSLNEDPLVQLELVGCLGLSPLDLVKDIQLLSHGIRRYRGSCMQCHQSHAHERTKDGFAAE